MAMKIDRWALVAAGGLLVATQAFGKAVGPCGTLTVTKKVFPAKPRHRSYGLQVDSSRTYSTATSPKLTSTLSLSAF